MSTQRPYNFSAGPAILPPSVFERAASAVQELRGGAHTPDADGIGLSILEISHRSADYTEVNAQATALCHDVLGIPDSHEIFFLQGGASLQFAMVPMNLRQEGKSLCYVDTGAWSKKAIREAKLQGETKVLASSADSGYDHIPELPEVPSDAAYVHITTNNTIYGTEYSEIPQLPEGIPLVADMSSHIGDRPMALERIAVGYAGAQKNLGPSGVTLAFVRKDLLERPEQEDVPYILRYQTHAGKLYNTPNTFGVLVLKLMLEWVRDNGGMAGMKERNEAKAGKLYAALDESSLFQAHARAGHRSLMNVAWTLNGAAEDKRDELTKRFLSEAGAAGFSGLKGHRSVGGCRASIYNAFPPAGVDALIDFMQEFERKA